MEAVRDHNGKIRYIEQRFPDGKPKVWYQYVGRELRKYENNGMGISASAVDAATFGFP